MIRYVHPGNRIFPIPNLDPGSKGKNTPIAITGKKYYAIRAKCIVGQANQHVSAFLISKAEDFLLESFYRLLFVEFNFIILLYWYRYDS
jgi:hypothetical protein